MKLKYLFYELLAIPLLVPLVHNSCNATFIDIIPNEETTVGNSRVICDEYFNCTSTWGNNEYNGLAVSPNEFKTLFWNSNSQLSYIYYYTNRGNSTVATFYRSGSNVIKVSYSDGLNYNRDSCDYLSSPEEISWDTFIETYKGKQITKYHKTYPNDIVYGCLCLVYNETDGAICFNTINGLGNPGNYGFYSVDGNYGLTNSFIPSDIQNLSVYAQSPLTAGGGSNGYDPFINSEEIYYSDNKQNYMDTFNAIGFYSGLCYSDFAINDIVFDSTSFGSFFPTFGSDILTGATIFDLKNNLFSSWSNSAWFDNLNGYYKSVDKDFSRVSLYSGHSKGYFRLFYKLNNADFIDSYTLNGKDVFSYCDMVINGYDPTDLFTGSLSPSFENIYLSLRDNPYYLSGAVDPNGPKDLKGLFNQLFTNLKGSFKIDDTLEGTPGILPTYIIFGFFLFLLYYVFRK